MQAGLMDSSVDYLGRKVTADRYGASKVSWEETAPGIPCSVDTKQSGLSDEDGNAAYHEVLTFHMRYTDTVKEYGRLRWEGRLYTISAIDRTKRRYGELMVRGELIDE